MMKIALLAGVAIVVAGPCFAQTEGAWCLHESSGGGAVAERCHFSTETQCRQMASGGNVFCTPNPRYAGQAKSATRKKAKQQ